MYVYEPAILYWLKKKAREGRAREDGDRTIFRVTLPAKLFLLSGVLVLIFVEILMFFMPGDTPLWQELALVPIVLFLLFCGSGSIILDSTGVSKRNLLGLRRTIPWHDVRTLNLVARRQVAYIGRGTGLRMEFTAYHVDLRRFVEEVRRRVPGANFTSDL